MPKIIEIIEKRKKYRIEARATLGGHLKERFLDELDKGVYKEGEIIKSALDAYLPISEKRAS